MAKRADGVAATERRGKWALRRGASVLPGGGVRFAVWAPRARSAAVRLYDADGRPRGDDRPLERDDDGVFHATVADARAGDDYRFVLDGEREVADPVSRWQPDDVFGPSRVVDAGAFRWTDDAWRGVEMPDLVIYEVHVGTFSQDGTFEGIVPHLPYLRDLGVTAIELMPVAEFPGARNWGYDGVHLFAAESAYGGPEGLRRLVDAAHAHGIAVILDVVYNHTGPEGSVLHEYGTYFAERHVTPWGGGLNTDGPDAAEVRRYVVDNALYWVTEYHLDGLRLDASDHIADASELHLLSELAEAVHAQARALGRTILVTAETAMNDPRWVRTREQGGFGHDATWLDDFHHAVRTSVTGERLGYYGDYHGVQSLLKSYADRYVYDGQRSPLWGRARGAPARDVPTSRFVTFVQNHDQVGNRAHGERLTALASVAQCRLAAAALLLSPFVPLLFMGEEYGEVNPFLYFVDHHGAELLDSVRRGRREEFSNFAWEEEVADPGAASTFERSRVDVARSTEPGHREMLALYRDLLAVRAAEPLLRPGRVEPAVGGDAEEGVVTLHYRAAGGTGADLWVALSFAGETRELAPPPAAGGTWRPVLATDDVRYGGAGMVPGPVAVGGTTTLAPHSAVLFRLEPDASEVTPPGGVRAEHA